MACDCRVAAVVGRHARLELAFEHRNRRTVLTHAYVEPPLRIGRAFELDGAAYLILVCTGPGVFAGDSLHHRVSVARGARVVIASQSALQIHPSDAPSPAILHHDYEIEEGGELHCLWDPVVPFARARLVQRFDLRAGAGSRLYWSDALMSGRVSRGESWQFESIDHELRFAAAGSLKYLERFRLLRGDRALPLPWATAGADYLGTTIVYHADATPGTAERLHRDLLGIDRLTAAVDMVETRVLVGRLFSAHGAPFVKGRTLFRETALEAVFGNPRLVARR